MKKMAAHRNKMIVASVTAVALLVPQLAFAGSGGGVLGFLSWGVTAITQTMNLVGALLALAGLVALGLGSWDFVQHFKQGQHDSADGKSRIGGGIAKFVVGILLGTGAYQQIANEEQFRGSLLPADTTAPIVVSVPVESINTDFVVAA